MIIVLLILFAGLIALSVPVAYSLGIASAVWTWIATRIPLIMVAQRMYAGINSTPLMAIPFFILAGKIMARGGISDRLIKVASVLVGRFRGGLAYINIVASMFFAGITGSATADSSSIGSILIPAMTKKGYDKDFSVAVTATSSTIGILIPPSIPMVIYGILMDQSIGQLFIAGAVPGVLVALALMAISGVISARRGYPREDVIGWADSLRTIVDGVLPLFTIVIVLGGIIAGIVTATEAAVIAVVYSFLLSFFIYRELPVPELPGMLLDTIKVTGMVMLMVATASVFSWIITSQHIPRIVGEFLLETIGSRFLMLLLFNIVLLLAGAILDLTPAMIIFIPVLAPIAQYVGVDLIHFGVIVVANLGIGLFTPPVGACLFVSCSIAGINMRDTFRGFLPFFVTMLGVLLAVTYIPELSLWLPRLVQ